MRTWLNVWNGECKLTVKGRMLNRVKMVKKKLHIYIYVDIPPNLFVNKLYLNRKRKINRLRHSNSN